MPLYKFSMLLMTVIAAAGLTLWLADLVGLPATLTAAVPVALAVWLLGRIATGRWRKAGDDRHDRTER